MEKKTYKFEQDGKSFEFTQQELYVKKDYAILKLLSSLDLKNITAKSVEDIIKNINISSFVNLLSENEALESFLEIILDPVNELSKGYHFTFMPNRHLEEVIMDFFDLNPTVKNRLKDSSLNAVLQILIKILPTLETTAKT